MWPLLSYWQALMGKEKNSGKEVISAQQAEDLKMKEKRKREREVLIILNLFICLFDSYWMEFGNFWLIYNWHVIGCYMLRRKICRGRSVENWKQLEKCWRMKIKLTSKKYVSPLLFCVNVHLYHNLSLLKSGL